MKVRFTGREYFLQSNYFSHHSANFGYIFRSFEFIPFVVGQGVAVGVLHHIDDTRIKKDLDDVGQILDELEQAVDGLRTCPKYSCKVLVDGIDER